MDDADIGREILVDETNTINKYNRLADQASPSIADLIRDIAHEEKVHTGEAAAIISDSDPEAKPAMIEGVKEASAKIPRFKELLADPDIGASKQEPRADIPRFSDL